jgi:tetratricopeptide (TPR) repeat protein
MEIQGRSRRRDSRVRPVIGYLHIASPEPYAAMMAAFRRLRDAGYFEGQNVATEYRWAEGPPEQLPTLAAELVTKKVAVLVTGGCDLPPRARVQLEQILAIDKVETDRSLSVRYVADPHASGLAYLALSLWALGYPEAIKHARDANHGNTSGVVGIYAGAQLSVLLGKMEDVKSYVENLNARLESRVPLWAISCGQILSGWAIGCAEQLEEGIALMKYGIHATEQQVRFHSPHYHSLLAILQARTGNKQDSLSAIRKAKELMFETGEYLWHADVLRIEGELQLLFGASTKEAEATFVQALEVARKQRAKSFELRAAMNVTRLWRDHGKRDEARQLLATVYGWFTEGFDTLDLKQARALLTELA